MGQVVHLPASANHRPNRGHVPARPRILLAYPGQGQREYLAVFLASRGYEVTACANGEEALAHLAAAPFELVVSGILMPHMDGLELVGALRRQAGPPVITVADGLGKMDGIYLRSAILCGAVAAHTFCEASGALLASADWILRGRDDVTRGVVW